MESKIEEKDLEPQSIINDKYSIIRKIGEGGFAKVYLVQEKNDNIKYAAKILFDKVDSKNKQIYENEKRILKKLTDSSKSNIHISKFHDSGEGPVKKDKNLIANKQYLISQFIKNGNLAMYLDQTENGFSEDQARIIFYKILLGIKSCHEESIAHLDINFNNILLDSDFNPIITDFGLSKEMVFSKSKNEYENIKWENIKGCWPFICPEILHSQDYKGVKADIFSLGAVLFYLVTKSYGFDVARRSNSLYKLIVNPKKINDFWEYHYTKNKRVSELSPEIKNLFLKMVAYSSAKRYNSIEEIIDKDPWMSKIEQYKEEDYTEYKNTMIKLKEKAKENNPAFDSQLQDDEIQGNENFGFKSFGEDSENYFDEGQRPDYIYSTGLNAQNYIKINGKLNPSNFMNSLAHKMEEQFDEICEIKPSPKKLNFIAIFYYKKEEEIEEEDEYEDEEKKDEIENIRLKSCEIKIKLFESINGGYEVHFNKGEGDFTKYYEYYSKIKSIIKKLIKSN